MSRKLFAAFVPLVAVMAVMAGAAASAAAYPAYPEYKKCVKASPKNTGEYTEKECKTSATPAKTGKFELEPWKEGDNWEFTSKSKSSTITAKSTLGVAETVVCKKDSGTGSIVTAGYFTEETLTFTGCRANGSRTQPCENVGTEEIETAHLVGLLVYLPGESTIGERLNFAQEHGPFAVFRCGAETVELEGEVIGTVENTSKGPKVTFTVVAGKQQDMFTEFEGAKEGPFHLVSAGVNPEEATLETTEQRAQKGVGAY
jgi:hypothetical protein